MKMLKDWLKETTKMVDLGFATMMEIRPQINCADGFTISVQASENHYCTPRENLNDGSYTELELGFPSEKVDSLYEYAEEPTNPTETVYAYVPIELVEKIISEHGGIK